MTADLSEDEIDRRRDEVVKRMLNTPPTPRNKREKRKADKPKA